MIAFATLVVIYGLSFTDLLIPVASVGFAFSACAWLLTWRSIPLLADKLAFKKESFALFLLIGWVILYITYGPTLINNLFPKNIRQDDQWQFFIAIARKLVVFVIVPFFLYRSFGFNIRDFGLQAPLNRILGKKNILVFLIMSLCILAFEFFFSGGAQPLRRREFSVSQLAIGLPLAFLWLFIEAGLVEEFFFRALLQSRLSALIKSHWGAILIGGLIFGLAHVPGLYLRGSESEGIKEQLPVWFWICYCVVNMSIAGVFLGIIWAKTKNLYLVMSLHAMIDLLPNLNSFIHTWKI